MSSSSYHLEVDHLRRVSGPLALIAPQAAAAAVSAHYLVRVLDADGRAARLRQVDQCLETTWDQPNELFPATGTQPRWIERLRDLLADLDLG